jgi:large subunit ribosomal protein L21
MFAVVVTGGKQYKVAADDVIKVEKLDGAAGDKIQLDNILMIGDDKGVKVGSPALANTVVGAEILEQIRDKKIRVFKKKRRKGYQKTQGHRQFLTVLRITDIGGTKKAAPKPKKAAAKKADVDEAKAVTKPTPKKAAPKKPPAEKTEVKKAAPKKAAPKKAAAKKAPAKKAPAKKAPAKKAAAKKPSTTKKETK